MDRFYRALRGLAVAAIALGVIAAVVIGYSDWWNLQNSTGINVETPSASFQALRFLGLQLVALLATLLDYGVCVMGITLAWLDHRKRWFVPLIIVTLAAHLFPAILNVWDAISPSNQISLYVLKGLNGFLVFVVIVYLIPLIAVLVTLIFTREIRQDRVDVDADLGITRSTI